MECTLCLTPMTKTGTLNSSNSTFHEYTCKNCAQRKTICAGITQ